MADEVYTYLMDAVRDVHEKAAGHMDKAEGFVRRRHAKEAYYEMWCVYAQLSKFVELVEKAERDPAKFRKLHVEKKVLDYQIMAGQVPDFPE
ncbi:MAG: hypothetical protein U1F10_00565 [Burkholderiales bacterium]